VAFLIDHVRHQQISNNNPELKQARHVCSQNIREKNFDKFFYRFQRPYHVQVIEVRDLKIVDNFGKFKIRNLFLPKLFYIDSIAIFY